ncbi:MAG: hypothetical protein MR361_04400 [Clostridiales bacterium]|nr:hypothetical protein [Clostridiales bacterium]
MTEEEILNICRDNIDSEKEIILTPDTEISVENGFESLTIMNIIIDVEGICDFELDEYIIRISEAKHIKDMLEIINEAISKNNVNTDILESIKNDEKEYLYINKVDCEFHSFDEILMQGNIVMTENGGICLSGISAKLFDYFDKVFKKFAIINLAIEERYPVLLSKDTLIKTKYLNNYPGNSMYVEDSNAVLSPSACFHVYERYKDTVFKDNTSLTFLQNVFRNEKDKNNEFGRLRDYHVREIVFVGSEEYVDTSINRMINQTSRFMVELGLKGDIESATDLFITPNMNRYKLIQMHNKAKYELRLEYDNNRDISVASFNRHGKTFSHTFNIGVSGVENVVSGCIGYGIECFVMAFLSQYGCNVENMPKCVRDYIES